MPTMSDDEKKVIISGTARIGITAQHKARIEKRVADYQKLGNPVVFIKNKNEPHTLDEELMMNALANAGVEVITLTPKDMSFAPEIYTPGIIIPLELSQQKEDSDE